MRSVLPYYRKSYNRSWEEKGKHIVKKKKETKSRNSVKFNEVGLIALANVLTLCPFIVDETHGEEKLTETIFLLGRTSRHAPAVVTLLLILQTTLSWLVIVTCALAPVCVRALVSAYVCVCVFIYMYKHNCGRWSNTIKFAKERRQLCS